MTAQTTVHLLRHGEVHNPAKILYGRLPGYRLSDEGVAMAKRAADWFADKDVVHLVASPLERTQQTARPLAEAKGLEISVDERIIEAGNAFEGLALGSNGGLLRAPRYWWTLRLHAEGRRYVHDPRRRECALASVTSVHYDGDRLDGVTYAEPAGATPPDAVPGA